MCEIQREAKCVMNKKEKIQIYENSFSKLNENFQVVGVAFHVGSACYSKESYQEGLKQTRALFDHEAKSGRHMSIVDIGGGFISDNQNRIDEVFV